MKDLVIEYKTTSGSVKLKEYNTIMDFETDMKQAGEIASEKNAEVLHYMFFENPLNAGSGGTIADLLEHCQKILQ